MAEVSEGQVGRVDGDAGLFQCFPGRGLRERLPGFEGSDGDGPAAVGEAGVRAAQQEDLPAVGDDEVDAYVRAEAVTLPRCRISGALCACDSTGARRSREHADNQFGEFAGRPACRLQVPGGRVGGSDLVVAVLQSLEEFAVTEEIAVAAGLVVLGSHPPGQLRGG